MVRWEKAIMAFILELAKRFDKYSISFCHPDERGIFFLGRFENFNQPDASIVVQKRYFRVTMESSANPHLSEIISHLRSLHGNVPLHRKESKKRYTFSKLPFVEQLHIWDRLWHTENNFWLRLHAFFFLERHLKQETELRKMWPVIVAWQDQIDDWGLCDALAKVYTKILEVMPTEVYTQLQEWNTDPNLWKRRQSLVSLLYYSRTKKTYLTFDQITWLITPLLQDKEYYVQKGLGWTLRELHTVYPQQTLSYLNHHIKQVSSIAFTIAIEKMNTSQKDQFKALRRLKAPSA